MNFIVLIKMFKHTVVFVCLLGVCFAALAHAPLQPKPDKFKDKEGCYVNDLDDVIPLGGTAPCPHHCMQYRCTKTDITIETCGAVGVTDGFKVVEDHSKPYPDCCGKIVPV